MKTISAIGATLACLSIFGFCNLPQNPDEYRQWEPKLGRWINKLSGGGNVETGARPVFHAAQAALLAIPGHAKYYQDKIEQTRAFAKYYHGLSEEEQSKLQEQSREEEARRNSPVGNLTDRLDYDDVRSDAFNILGLLPSPETVAVLGHFLEDPEGRDGKDFRGYPIHIPGADAGPPAPNCGKAYFALGRLGIEYPPIPPTNMEDVVLDQEHVDAWTGWWNEVKTGKRTYRFKGSPIEYGADGPATKEQIDKARTTRERDEKRAAGHSRRKGTEEDSLQQAETNERSSPMVILIAAAVAVLASMAWYGRRKKTDG
jgi:hypothetical protein